MKDSTSANYNLFYAIVISLCALGLIVFFVFCFRHRRKRANGHHNIHSYTNDSIIKPSVKSRQPVIHYNGATIPSTTPRMSNEYIANSNDSIPISRQCQRYGHSLTFDRASLTNSNVYYTRLQAL